MLTRRSSSHPASRVSEDFYSAPSSANTAVEMSQTESAPPKPDWWADRYSIMLLVALYTAQGLPMGLAFGSIPFLLKERGSSYADLAKFSFASLPYSIKLLIAPIVDSLYNRSFGRRKSWIVPVQLAIGSLTYMLSSRIHDWVNGGRIDILMPTFLFLIALTATQDIAVDGWSLTMLRPENVSYASTCQSLGLSLGFFATFTIFLALSNEAFSDSFARPVLFMASGKGAILDLASTLRIVGLFYVCLTFYITLVKSETPDSSDIKKSDGDAVSEADECEKYSSEHESRESSNSNIYQKIASTYSDLFVAVRLSAVQSLVVCLLVAKIGVSAYDNGKLFFFQFFSIFNSRFE